MKKILFISVMNGAAWGGSEEFWYRMALWMARNGYEVECSFFDWPTGKESRKEALTNAGCTLHLLPNPKIAKNYLHRLLLKSHLKKSLLQLVKQDHDLVCISQGGVLDVTFKPFDSMLPYLKKFVLVYHNYNEDAILSPLRRRLFHKWSYAAIQNMGDAAKIFSAIQKVAGFRLPGEHVLINPITIPVQEKPAEWPMLSENGNYIWIVLAELDVERKAQDILIKTLAADKWKQRNLQLHLYGAGQDKQLLTQLIADLKLDKKIFLEGHTSNVKEVLERSHMLLQITHFDAMPLSVTEAMNMARPCIVSNVGDMPLWIEDGKQGFVVAKATEAMIDEVLERAWQQKESWPEMGLAAFNMFRQKYPDPYESYYENFFLALMKK
jgi:glycosyltransferase involved in cell wall biosynthesis